MAETGIVRVISSQGASDITGAIEKALLDREAQRMVDEAKAEKQEAEDKLRRAEAIIRTLEGRLALAETLNKNNQQARDKAYTALLAGNDDFKRWKDFRITMYVVMVALGAMVAMLATVIAVIG